MPGDFEFKILSEVKSPIAIFSKDKAVLFANGSFLGLSGLDASIIGLALEDAVEDVESIIETMRLCRSVSGGVPCRITFRGSDTAHHFSLSYAGKGEEGHYLLQSMQRGTDRFMNLNRQIEDLNHALARESAITKKYKATNKGVEQFLQKLVHDIRSPLSSIASAASLAKDDAVEGNQESLLSMLDMSEESAHRLISLTDRLYEDLRSQRAEPKLEEVSLRELVDDLKRDLSSAIQEVGGEVVFKGDAFLLQADRLLLHQLLQNLLQNSIKFRSEDRPLVITVSAENDSEGRESIQVQDNGRGFEQNVADGLFERFYRLNPDEGDGLGLGLSTCRQIAELHGWKISAIGLPDRGATFKLLLS